MTPIPNYEYPLTPWRIIYYYKRTQQRTYNILRAGALVPSGVEDRLAAIPREEEDTEALADVCTYAANYTYECRNRIVHHFAFFRLAFVVGGLNTRGYAGRPI